MAESEKLYLEIRNYFLTNERPQMVIEISATLPMDKWALVHVNNPDEMSEVRGNLNLKNIEASVHFDPPVHKQTAYNSLKIKLDQTEKLSSEIVSLPISSVQTKLQTKYVIKKIKLFFKLQNF